MTPPFVSCIADRIWPSLDGEPSQHQRNEIRKLRAEELLIEGAVANLPSNEAQLKEHLGASEKLLEEERSRKAGIESRLLNAAGLVSIAGTVVLGGLFSLASEKLSLNSSWARIALSIGCLYLAVQLVAALRAAVIGLKAAGYGEDTPHQLLPRNGTKYTAFLRERIQQVLFRIAEHRLTNDRKMGQLNIAHCAMENFLWGLLAVALIACIVSLVSPLSPPTACPDGTTCQTTPPKLPPPLVSGVKPSDFGLPVVLMSGGMCMAALGVLLLVSGGATSRRAVGVVLTLGGLGLGLTGLGKLENIIFKIDKVIGELRLEFPMGAKGHAQQSFVRRIVTVGPFPDGDHLLAEDEVAQCVKTAIDQYKDMRVGGWEVIGRVDKRNLKTDRTAIYGSNQALAMSRANWVAQKILASQLAFDSANAIVSIGGARGVGAMVGTNELQSDRAVDIFALITARVDEKGLPTLPSPVICPRRIAVQ